MKDKTFYTILLAVVVLGVASLLIHAAYAIHAYEHSSIIQFVGLERW